MGRKFARSGLPTVIAAGILFITSTAAFANVLNGRAVGGPSSYLLGTDGAKVQIDGDSFHPTGSGCVLYAVLVGDTDRQIETGLVRCADDPLDPPDNCDDAAYVEMWRGPDQGDENFTCVEYGSFTDGSTYSFSLKRTTSTSTQFQALLFASGVDGGTLGNLSTTSVLTVAGAEWLGSNACAFGSDAAHFYNFNRFNYGSGYTPVGGFVYADPQNPAFCWDVSSINSSGDFHVTHS